MRRLLLRAALLATTGVLTGCPQVLNDDFRIVSEPHTEPVLPAGKLNNAGGSGAMVIGGQGSGGTWTTSVGENGSGHEASHVGGATNIAAGTGGSPMLNVAEIVGPTEAAGATASGGRDSTAGTPNEAIGGEVANATGGSGDGRGGWSSGGMTSTGGTSTITTTMPGGTGGAAAGAPGVEATDCGNMVVLRDPLVAGFDSWDGKLDLYSWRFSFNSSAAVPVTGTFERYNDGSGDYSLTLVPGTQSTRYAARAENSAASRWGGGIMLALHCLDASSFKGLQFWVKGSTPARTMAVAMGLTARDVSYQFDIPSQWKQIKVPFASFSGWSGDTPGKAILFISFSSQLRYLGSTAQTGAFDITVDEVGFY